MEQPVSDITFHFPDRREIAAAASSGRVRPRSQVIFCLEGEGGREPEQRVHWVPARVARSFEHDHPEPPCPYREAREALEARENKLCLAALTEMLGRRDYGAEEARRKLRHAGFRPTAIDHALERAQELRFLDEERFLVSYIEERIRRGWGRLKIEADLRQRGSDPHMLPGYPERFFSAEDDLERACAVLARKPVPERNPFERLVRHLMGKGFPYRIAAQAVRIRLEGEESD